jgi:hypothetical protein
MDGSHVVGVLQVVHGGLGHRDVMVIVCGLNILYFISMYQV